MKKLLLSLFLLLFTLSSVQYTFASITKEQLTKEIILSRAQIRHEYKNGVSINTKIERFFITNRNNTEKLLQIEKDFGNYLKKKKSKTLTKKANIIKNIYLRAILKLRY